MRLAKAWLFLAAGILLHRTATLDEIELTARPRHLRWTAGLFWLGAAALAGLPPFGTFWGDVMISGSAYRLGFHWINWVTFAASAITSGAVLRFAGRAFLRWGPPAEEFAIPGSQSRRSRRHAAGEATLRRQCMYRQPLWSSSGGLFGLSPRLTGTAEAAAIHIQDRAAYAQVVLDMMRAVSADGARFAGDSGRYRAGIGNRDRRRAAGRRYAAFGAACGGHLENRARRTCSARPCEKCIAGSFRDYVTWLVAGVALFGAAAFAWMR